MKVKEIIELVLGWLTGAGLFCTGVIYSVKYQNIAVGIPLMVSGLSGLGAVLGLNFYFNTKKHWDEELKTLKQIREERDVFLTKEPEKEPEPIEKTKIEVPQFLKDLSNTTVVNEENLVPLESETQTEE